MSLVQESYEYLIDGRCFRYAIVREGRDDDWLRLGVTTILPDDWDPNAPYNHDGEWVHVITLAHEMVEWDGYVVPAFEGDLERIEWERRRSTS